MPEGPEVRRFADRLAEVLTNQPLVELSARTRTAKQWLQSHSQELIGRRILSVRSHGKNLLGFIEGDYYFYSHLMMWGSWQTFQEAPSEVDRRERARIVVPTGGVILYSAPVFELGQGDPYTDNQVLRSLGPDVLPYEAGFDQTAFCHRLLAPIHQDRAIGAALLDQQIVAGIGNYLRAEILFDCRLDPWRRIADLSTDDLTNLSHSIAKIAQRAYETGGVTVPEEVRSQMQQDPSLVYRLGSDFGSRHYVFRRTNLPCLVCSNPIRQLRQTTRADETGEKTRIIYFCPVCQQTQIELKPSKRRAASRSV